MTQPSVTPGSKDSKPLGPLQVPGLMCTYQYIYTKMHYLKTNR